LCHVSSRVPLKDSLTVPEDASHDFTCRSLHLEFFFPHLSTVPIKHLRLLSFCG
jgi:hypothetical protein